MSKDTSYLKSVVNSQPLKPAHKNTLNKIIDQSSGNADAMNKITAYLGKNIFVQTTSANNPPAEAAAVIKETTGGAASSVLPEHYDSTVAGVNEIHTLIDPDTSIASIVNKADVPGANTITRKLLNLDHRTGNTPAVSIKTKDGVAHTATDVKTHLESLNDRLGNTAAVSIKTKDGVAHTATDVKTHLDSLNDRLGNTAAVSIKTKDGVAHTTTDVKTHLESLNDRTG
ncbi:MAG: hypothetical protein WBJ81_03495, partial [Rickettsiales bacterium]